MKKISNKRRIELIKKWSQWFYERTSSFETRLGAQLAYLWAAIASDHCVELAKHAVLVRVLNDNAIPKTDEIWRYIHVQ